MDNALPREGETYFLNLRFILILTVCIANAAEPLIRQMDGLHTLYSWIYTYHMPLFVFVTGYFAKGGLGGPEGRKALLQIGLQYIIFQSLYSLLDVALFKVPDIRHSFFVPYLMLWFLASHMAWRLLMLSMRRFAPAAQCSISLILGVLVGYLPLDGTWLSISRTFVYLPFFVIGYHFSFAAFKRRVTPLKKIGAAALSAALLAVIAFHGIRLPEGWLFGSQTYLQLGRQEWYAGAYRLALYGLQSASGAAFLGWIPFRHGRLTDLGRRTLYVFLLHGIIVRLAAALGLYGYIRHPAEAAVLLAGAVLMACVLAQPFVKKAAYRVIEPQVGWILRLERIALGKT